VTDEYFFLHRRGFTSGDRHNDLEAKNVDQDIRLPPCTSDSSIPNGLSVKVSE
jgi:hypothetical protein